MSVTFDFGDGQQGTGELDTPLSHEYTAGGSFRIVATKGDQRGSTTVSGPGAFVVTATEGTEHGGDANPVPVLTSIDPTELPVGPPEDTVLHCYGTGFVEASQIRFGPTQLERTDFVSATEVSTIITGGLFPGADPAVPVTVFTPGPGGGETDPQIFAFVEEES